LNICFYTSDYGYGHAARDIAVIRGLVGSSSESASTISNNIKIYVKTDFPYNFMSNSLNYENIRVERKRNDYGPLYSDGTNSVDMKKTEIVLSNWIDSWDNYIKEEKKFCKDKEIDIILSDIAPQPFIVANKLGIPSIAISNFTWYFIYKNIFGQTELTENLREAYQYADLALVLPFNENMEVFKEKIEVSLVSREISENKDVFRKRYGVNGGDLLVYLGTGRSFSFPDVCIEKEVKFILSSNSDLTLSSRNNSNILRIPENETESQNYLAMCDLVVSKTGYSTASEAIKGEVPMFMFPRDGYYEDSIVADTVENLGIGKKITFDDFVKGEWTGELDNLERYRERYASLEDRFTRDGLPQIKEVVTEVAS